MRNYTQEEALSIGNQVTRFTTLLIIAAAAFIVGVVITKLLWAWTVPDLFPTAVEQELIASEISWWASVKTVALAAALTSTGALLVGRFRE